MRFVQFDHNLASPSPVPRNPFMRKARSSFRFFPDAPVIRLLCHSAFSGPWPGLVPEELDEARERMLEHAAWCGIDILAFSLRPTSFDILLDAPARTSSTQAETSLNPFGPASAFLKRFKQAVAQSYHKRRLSRGTLWDGRFRSTFVEPGHTSRIIAAWIDHGSAREAFGVPPEADPHCTIGWAATGGKPARAMIQTLFAGDGSRVAWPAIRKAWSEFTNGEPQSPRIRGNGEGQALLGRPSLLRHPVPHFHGGIAVGSRGYLERLYELNRPYFSEHRETGPRLIGGQNDPDLFTFRDKGDLRKPPRSNRGRNPVP